MFAARMMCLLAVAVAGLATAACSEPGTTFEFPPTDVVYEGDQIRIRAASGLEPCGDRALDGGDALVLDR